jgi:signal transduction histidine kinase
MLSWVKLAFQNRDEKIKQLQLENWESYQELYGKLDEPITLTREISQDLDSGVLNRLGLVAAIKDLTDTISGSVKLNIDFETLGMDNRLPKVMEEPLFRIVQEVLNNILKHANATEVMIQLSCFGNDLNLMIEDNGIGFDIEEIEKGGGGMGLKNIRSRVLPFHGSVEFDSRKGRGTIVNINSPIVNDI